MRDRHKLMTREFLRCAAIPCAFVLVFAFLVIRFASSTSATYDETAHLAAGCTYLKWNDYRFAAGHPPLIKKWAALFVSRLNPWPPDVNASEQELTPKSPVDSLAGIKRSWALGLANDDSEWLFSHYFLYGPKLETLERLGVGNPMQLPTTVALTQKDFLNNADDLLFWGRMAILLLGVLLAVLVFSWAGELWGLPGGVLSMALFCFDPNFIAHSGLVTTDVGEAAFMFGAVYFLWRTCKCLEFVNMLLMLLFFSLALVSKFNSVLLVPIFVLLLSGRIFSGGEWPVASGQRKLAGRCPKALVATALLVAAGVAAYLTIWAAYGFRYSAANDPLQAAKMESRALASLKQQAEEAGLDEMDKPLIQVKRWREPGHFPIEYVVRHTAALKSVLKVTPNIVSEPDLEALDNTIPIGLEGSLILYAARIKLLPEAFLYGFADARLESLLRGSFLRGEYSSRGFWSYFPWAFALKTPLVTLAVMAAGLVFAMRRRQPWNTRIAFLIVPVVVYLGVSMSSNLNIGQRHLLPVYPFLFVLAGVLGQGWENLRPQIKPHVACLSLAAVAVGGSVVFAPPWNPVVVYPHYLAYFNELAGGPRQGHESLVDSNLDWGQDLKELKTWLDKHPDDGTVYLCYFGTADPRYYGIRHVNVPWILGGLQFEPSPYVAFESKGLYKEAIQQFARDVHTGDYIVISATSRNGVYVASAAREIWRGILSQSVLVDHIGFSIYIYKVEPPVH